jgi:hypothetical protein
LSHEAVLLVDSLLAGSWCPVELNSFTSLSSHSRCLQDLYYTLKNDFPQAGIIPLIPLCNISYKAQY